ncbi:MAG: hypothetical protein JSV77_10490 [Dehalococcoidales bacterium]|nr:MAG: hypothetical protein JSV77_10490 [Dehalococcoidales bacterium]
MVGMYILGGLLLFGLVAFIFFKIKWNRSDKALALGRAERIEKEKIEATAKAEIGGSN